MKTNMKTVKLGEVTEIDIIDGDRGINYPQKSDFFSNEHCLFLDASNVTKNGFVFESPQFITKHRDELLRNGKLIRGDIVLTTRGTIGNFAYYDEKVPYENMRINSGMLIIRNNGSRFNTTYLYFFLKAQIIQDQIKNITTGSSQPQITRAIVQELVLFEPSFLTQTAIDSVLSSLDDKTALNNKINVELEQTARLIYDYWFVQNADKKRKKIKKKKLGVEVIRGVTYNKNDIKNEKDKNVIGILRATNINGNVIDLDDLVYVDKSKVSENQKLNPLDILITMSSGSKEHIGKNGLFPFKDQDVAFGAFCSKIKIEEKYNIYLYMHFQSEQFRTYVKNSCLGTNINNLNNNLIFDILCAVPDEKKLQSFQAFVSPIFDQIIANRQQSNELRALRDWLLPMLMTGQATVKDKGAP
jgi:type I restriction enzyme S subunit